MFDRIPIIAIAITLVLVLFVVFAIIQRKSGKPHRPNYRVMFILGITWLPLGIATDNPGFWGVGAVMMIVGMANKSKWEREPKWSELTPEARRLKLYTLGGLTLLLIIGIITYLVF